MRALRDDGVRRPTPDRLRHHESSRDRAWLEPAGLAALLEAAAERATQPDVAAWSQRVPPAGAGRRCVTLIASSRSADPFDATLFNGSVLALSGASGPQAACIAAALTAAQLAATTGARWLDAIAVGSDLARAEPANRSAIAAAAAAVAHIDGPPAASDDILDLAAGLVALAPSEFDPPALLLGHAAAAGWLAVGLHRWGFVGRPRAARRAGPLAANPVVAQPVGGSESPRAQAIRDAVDTLPDAADVSTLLATLG